MAWLRMGQVHCGNCLFQKYLHFLSPLKRISLVFKCFLLISASFHMIGYHALYLLSVYLQKEVSVGLIML